MSSKLTQQEKNDVVMDVLSDKNSVKEFINAFPISEIITCKDNLVELVAEKEANDLKEKEALKAAAQVFADKMKEVKPNITFDEALAILSGNAKTETKTKTKANKSSISTDTRFTLEVNGEIFEKVGLGKRGALGEKLEKAFAAVGATKEEKWKFIVESEHDRFFEQLKTKKLSSHIDLGEAKDHYGRDMMPEVDLSDKVDYRTITITKQRASEEFGFELIEDFNYKGSQDELTKEQQDFLIEISKDGTVEGGIEVIEALD